MTNTKNTKRALLSSVMALFLCFTMLLGTTFAWFTDRVTSANNVIKSGTLNVEMYYADGSKAVPADNSTDWKNAQGVAIYTANQLWEPGYTDAKHIKISNEGSLALKYQLAIIIPTGTVSELAEVIDVYLYEIDNTDANATQIANRTDLDETMWVGTLADVISKGIVQGTLAADTDYTTTIVLKMQEDAGNEYQDKSIGADFTIQLLATQYTAEGDSFDDQYDKDAWVDGMQVYTASDLQAAINAGETSIKLMDDITLDAPIVIPAAATTFSLRSATPATVIDLNGKTITGNVGRDADGNRVHVIVNNGNAVIKNGIVKSAGNNGGSAIYNAAGATLTIEDVTVYGAPMVAPAWPSYGINNYGNMTVNGATVKSYHGAISTGGDGVTVINDATVDVGQSTETNQTSWALYSFDNGQVTVNGGTFANTKDEKGEVYGGGYICAISSKSFIVNGGTFIKTEGDGNGTGFYYQNKNLIINGGTFDAAPSAYVADGYHALQTDGKYYVVPEKIDAVVSNTAELQAAINAGDDEIILTEGNFTAELYANNANRNLTLIGQGAGTKLSFSNQQVNLALFDSLTIKNCTIEKMATKGWGHLVFGSSNNADGVYTISECIFNGVGTQGIYINQNVDATFKVEKCTFNGNFGKEGAITIQNNDAVFTVNVNDCEFNNIPEDSHDIYVVPYKDGTWYLNVDGKVTVATAKQLANVVANGATEINLLPGNYTMPQNDAFKGKAFTISGTKDAVIDISAIPTNGSQAFTGTTLVFDGVTLNCATTNYKGFTHGASLTYKNCQINGLQFLFAENVTFDNCDLNSNGAEHCVWTWSGNRNVRFTECDFTYGDRAVNCYGENGTTNISFTKCTFTKVAGKETTGAIETNSASLTALNLTINNCSVNEGNLWFVANPWDSLKGANTFVTVDGKVTVATAEQLRALAATATGDVEVVLISDITLGNDTDVCYAVNFANATSVTIDGNGNSIIFKGKAANKSDTSLDSVSGILCAGEITVKNVTLVNNKLSYFGTELSGDRIQVYTVVRGTSVSYENVTFEGGVQVKNNTKFLNCTFNEDCLDKNGEGYATNGKFCVFVDFEWSTDAVCTVEFEGCTFNARGYGCVKLAGDAGAELTANVKDCTFYNTCPSNSWSTTTPKYDVKCTGDNTSAVDLGGNTWAQGLANT